MEAGIIMIKRVVIIFLVICMLFYLVGCFGKKGNKYVSISELVYEDGPDWSDFNYVKGQIKNMTDKYLEVSVSASAKSGSINEILSETIRLKPNEMGQLEFWTITGINYTYTIDKVDVKELDIPKLDEKHVTPDALEYYYPAVYSMYSSLIFDLRLDFDLTGDVKSYITEAEITSEGLEIYYTEDVRNAWRTVWSTNDASLLLFEIKIADSVFKDTYSFLFNKAIDIEVETIIEIEDSIIAHNGEYHYGEGWTYYSHKENSYTYLFMYK